MYQCLYIAVISSGLRDAVPNLWGVGGPHREHPGADGGTLCLSSHSSSPLVSLSKVLEFETKTVLFLLFCQ